MSHQTAETFGDIVSRFLSIRMESKFFVRRSYDNWTWKQIFADKKTKLFTTTQKLDVDQHVKLGSDLATAKFVFRICNGEVRDGNGRWLKRKWDLPADYSKNFKLTAIKAADSNLVTEGVDNFVGLDYLESLDLSRNVRLDDFACDQLSRQFRKSKTLREINLSFNPLISVYGLEILFRIPSIKRIIALETQASEYENIDLFTLAAEEERQCQVFTLKGGRLYKSDELESLRWSGVKPLEITGQPERFSSL